MFLKTKLIAFFLIGIIVFPLNIPAKSQLVNTDGIGISPFDSNPQEPLSKSWFIENMNPGESKNLKAKIENYSSSKVVAIINAKDSVPTNSGAFSYIQNQEEDKEVGSWVELSQTEITLNPGESKIIEFEIKIPNEIESGEYAGVIAVQKKEEDSQNGIVVENRVGARFYITIGDNQSLSGKIEDLSFISPTHPNYDEFLETQFEKPYDNIFLGLSYLNTGSIFQNIEGSLEIISPTQTYNIKTGADAFPRTRLSNQLIELKNDNQEPIKWEAGFYSGTLKYKLKPLISSNKKIDFEFVEVEKKIDFEMTQEILEKMKQDREENDNEREIKIDRAKELGTTLEIAKKNQETPFYEKYLISIIILIGTITILAGLVVYLIKKKNKTKESLKESKENKTRKINNK